MPPTPKKTPTLLVIFGAGASYDSVAEPPDYADRDWRPPLAKQLFDNRRSFGEVMQRFPDALPVIAEVRSAVRSGALVETALQELRNRAGSYPPLERSLAAVRFYLQEVIWRSGNIWGEGAHGLTNYVELAARIEEWRYLNDARVLYVTFNYDLLLESACTHLSFSKVSEYVADEKTKVFKLHGSVNWGREIDDSTNFVAGDHRSSIAHQVGELKISDRFQILSKWDMPVRRLRRLFPALALPTQTKSLYECPEDHLSLLADLLPNVTQCLVVGWRGQEQHFLGIMSKALTATVRMHVVAGSEAGAAAVKKTLIDAGVVVRATAHSHGFSGYVAAPQHLRALVRAR